MKSMGATVYEEAAGVGKGREPLPVESQCPICNYFDTSHPDVVRILNARDSSGTLLTLARCKCQAMDDQRRSNDELRYGQANLPHARNPKTLDNFRHRPGTEEMFAAVEDFLRREGPPILVLVGTYGTGKSHLLEAIGRQVLEAGSTVRYDLCKVLLDRLRHTFSDDEQEDLHQLMAWYHRKHLLLLDDLGLEKTTPWGQEQVTTLVEHRLQIGSRLVIATNLTKDGLTDTVGPRLASRIYATNPELGEVRVVMNKAEDYRE